MSRPERPINTSTGVSAWRDQAQVYMDHLEAENRAVKNHAKIINDRLDARDKHIDKLEAENKRLREAQEQAVSWLDKAMDTGEFDKQYIHIGRAKQTLVRAALEAHDGK